ncbi:lipid A 3-O-deacylase [Maritimibacter sp. 55A14]|uniref:acyloxyacyl hydrolase n=1 Tax=Maritimibacter sp. 55A14 TaxID=2174844 RepID=UPI000D614694|nr:acyloxyacyl hydrolase [Maritimibacter sp. 55A14]PWE31361.1 lipid A 3-O-deacylase [Maritimibacter sp. 55A14]
MKRMLTLAFLLAGFQPAAAGEFILGAGYVDFSRGAGDEAGLTGEYHADPFTRLGAIGLNFGVAAGLHGNGDVWVGAGIAARADLGERWFVEGSVLPGYYEAGERESRLGGHFQIRSLAALGYRLDGGYGLSLSIDHKSNAGTEDFNPGVNTVSLRLHRAF